MSKKRALLMSQKKTFSCPKNQGFFDATINGLLVTQKMSFLNVAKNEIL